MVGWRDLKSHSLLLISLVYPLIQLKSTPSPFMVPLAWSLCVFLSVFCTTRIVLGI